MALLSSISSYYIGICSLFIINYLFQYSPMPLFFGVFLYRIIKYSESIFTTQFYVLHWLFSNTYLYVCLSVCAWPSGKQKIHMLTATSFQIRL